MGWAFWDRLCGLTSPTIAGDILSALQCMPLPMRHGILVYGYKYKHVFMTGVKKNSGRDGVIVLLSSPALPLPACLPPTFLLLCILPATDTFAPTSTHPIYRHHLLCHLPGKLSPHVLCGTGTFQTGQDFAFSGQDDLTVSVHRRRVGGLDRPARPWFGTWRGILCV